MSIIRASWANEFDNLIDFPREEIKQWFITFVNDNDDHEIKIKLSDSIF